MKLWNYLLKCFCSISLDSPFLLFKHYLLRWIECTVWNKFRWKTNRVNVTCMGASLTNPLWAESRLKRYFLAFASMRRLMDENPGNVYIYPDANIPLQPTSNVLSMHRLHDVNWLVVHSIWFDFSRLRRRRLRADRPSDSYQVWMKFDLCAWLRFTHARILWLYH